MSDKAFLDTNILIYFYSEDEEKKRTISQQILDGYDCITSLQAMNECCNVWLKKFSWNTRQVKEHLSNIEMVCDDVVPINKETISNALDLSGQYGYSYYDCLMLASALESKISR